MKDIAYLAAGLRIFIVVALPVTLAVYACVAAATAYEQRHETTKKRHRKE